MGFLQEELQRTGSLYDKIGGLPTEIIDNIIEFGRFSEPLGSHKALHTFMLICEEEEVTVLRERVTAAFKTAWMRKQIEGQWQLCPEFDYAKHHPYTIDEMAAYDLASWTIFNCSECIAFLLDHELVRASSYCKTGESFFYLAIKHEMIEYVEKIVSMLDPKHILQPWSLCQGEIRESIFQVSASKELWFRACWKRMKVLPDISLSSLGHHDVRRISRFADVSLAAELFDRGVDLGRSSPAFGSPGWWGVTSQKDPVPMLEWFWRQGSRPPRGYLEDAVIHGWISVASWTLQHTEHYEDWRKAALIAARDTDRQSVEMLELILKKPHPHQKADRDLAQELIISLVTAACDDFRVQRYSRAREPSYSDVEDFLILEARVSRLELSAVRKLEALKKISTVVMLGDLKVRTGRAGLYRLSDALGSIGH